ncbi:MAG: DUF58 domain-containing protein [Acidimicrobiales bacterium]
MAQAAPRSRLTRFGSVLALLVVVVLATPPQTSDPQVSATLFGAAAAVLAIGIGWPLLAVRRVRVAASSPRDATVGQEVPVEVQVSGVVGTCELQLLGPPSDWHRVDRAGTGTIAHLADRRGVFDHLEVVVRVTAPFGVFAAHRVHVVALPVPVEVAPKPMAVDWLPSDADVEGEELRSTAAALGGDLARAVRPYVPGDPSHLVHWPSTARTGSLVVRELEPPTPLAQAIVVDLRGLGADRERAASYAFGGRPCWPPGASWSCAPPSRAAR